MQCIFKLKFTVQHITEIVFQVKSLWPARDLARSYRSHVQNDVWHDVTCSSHARHPSPPSPLSGHRGVSSTFLLLYTIAGWQHHWSRITRSELQSGYESQWCNNEWLVCKKEEFDGIRWRDIDRLFEVILASNIRCHYRAYSRQCSQLWLPPRALQGK